MTTKNLSILSIALLALIALSACSPGFGSPDAAADSFFTAFEAQDEDALNDALCEDLDASRFLLDVDEDDELELDFNFDLKFVTDEENDDSAIVHAFGTTRYRAESDIEDLEVRRHSKDDTELFALVMTKEGDDWKVCDDTFIFQILPVGPRTLGDQNDPALTDDPIDPVIDDGDADDGQTDDTDGNEDTDTEEE